VHILFGILKRHGLLNYFVKAKRICAIGPETAKVVQSHGVQVDYVPDVYASTGIVKLFKRNGISRQQILLTAGDKSDDWLMKQLDALGNQCTLIEVYKNNAPKKLPQFVCDSILKGNISCLAVTSPSAIFNLLSVPQLSVDRSALMAIPVASIGPMTSEACSSLGLNVIVESSSHTLNGLAESIVNHGL
jgi:uroporphyrinogen-III synthase